MAVPYGPDAFIEADLHSLYDTDKILEIHDDVRLRPFGAEEYPAAFQFDLRCWDEEKIGKLSRTELVFEHLPRKHPVPAETLSLHARLRIIKRLKSPKDDEAQSLLCHVEERSGTSKTTIPDLPQFVVAKIYDPMFYSGMDVVADADRDCAHESNAYAQFERALDSEKTPKSTLVPGFQLRWYGAWFFLAQSEDPNFAGRTRPVRLILTEFVEGLSIFDMCGLDERGVLIPMVRDPPALQVINVHRTDADIASDQLLHWQRRMFIIDAVVDGLTRQEHMGVEHIGNLSPDQIIVEGGLEAVAAARPYSPYPAARATNKPRVVFINYTRSITGRMTAYGANSLQTLPKPCSPIDRDSNTSLASLKGWWPAFWDDLPKPDRNNIWPHWFGRTFNTTDYIRREEADPLLDDTADKMFDVQQAEEAKLPARFRRSTGKLKFLYKNKEAMKAMVEKSTEASRVHDEAWEAARAQEAERTPVQRKTGAMILEEERQERFKKGIEEWRRDGGQTKRDNTQWLHGSATPGYSAPASDPFTGETLREAELRSAFQAGEMTKALIESLKETRAKAEAEAKDKDASLEEGDHQMGENSSALGSPQYSAESTPSRKKRRAEASPSGSARSSPYTRARDQPPEDEFPQSSPTKRSAYDQTSFTPFQQNPYRSPGRVPPHLSTDPPLRSVTSSEDARQQPGSFDASVRAGRGGGSGRGGRGQGGGTGGH